jgi:exopolysaccharide biosynthesis protein
MASASGLIPGRACHRREIEGHLIKLRVVASATVFLAVYPSSGVAQQFDTATSRVVTPGVTHRRLVINSGPWRINVLEIDLHTPGLSIRGVRANDAFLGRETVRSMSERYKGPGKVVAALNGDFFSLKTGESENNVVIEGNLSKGEMVTDSPHDTFNNKHSQFAIDWRNHPFIDRFALDAHLLSPSGRARRVDGINFWPDSNSLVLYTSVFGSTTHGDSAGRHPLSLALRFVQQRSDTLVYRVAGKLREGGAAPLSEGGVLTAGGSRRLDLRALARRGGALRIVYGFIPRRGRLRTLMGGWPRLIVDGKTVAEYADIVEGTFPRFSVQRHPRTAIGFSRDSSTLFMVTVDGRRETDSGMSLVELSKLLLDIGVYQGMNFDGGGSTTMVVEGRVVNRPSDSDGERPVGSGLLVVIAP